MSNENKNSYPDYAFHQDHHHPILSEGFAFPIVTDHHSFMHPQPNPMSFTNSLLGLSEYNTLAAAFDFSCSQSEVAFEVTAAGTGIPMTPQEEKKDLQPTVCEEGDGKAKNLMNVKARKEEKKKKEGRFAFVTKSEVDNLEDGYRWRKYGQKAVKNSPFPRSYYRCTTQKCDVKKRIERSYQDPTVVITTYEGQHNHHSPATIRGSAAAMLAPSLISVPPQIFSFPQDMFLPHMNHFCTRLTDSHQQHEQPHEIPDHQFNLLMNGTVSSFLHKSHP